ncbi:MAG: GNAT family N-acetyltransferase [Erysipelotrichaceae bacterium]|nr:GNAT family N-acetyltransferase [Erysipelotrichaceae bacterium]
MKYRIAETDELERLYGFYNEIIDHQKYDAYGASWTKDVYPSKEDLKKHLEDDLFYVMEEEGRYVGAGCISLHEDENYLKAPWSLKLNENEIAVLHLLAIHPDFRGKGLSKKLLNHIIEDTSGKVKAIHLDVINGNDMAVKMYEKVGFRSIGLYEVYYEDTGNVMVNLMEYNY